MTTEEPLKKVSQSMMFALTFLERYLKTRTTNHSLSIDAKMC